jgi:MurNAc alpha-1-phosphate uridylyltransferase
MRRKKFSLNRMFDRAIEAGRMRSLRLDGTWMHVGAECIAAAERQLESVV